MQTMEMKLSECKIGDMVRLWCIGLMSWDDDVVEVVDNGVSSLVRVKYKSGRSAEFSPSTHCKKA